MIELVHVGVLTQPAMGALASRAKALSELLELGSHLRDEDRLAVQHAAAALAQRIEAVLRPITDASDPSLPCSVPADARR